MDHDAFAAYIENLCELYLREMPAMLAAKSRTTGEPVTDERRERYDGSVAGIQACRGKTVAELRAMADGYRTQEQELMASGAVAGDENRTWRDVGFLMGTHAVIQLASAWLALNGEPIIIAPDENSLAAAAAYLGMAMISTGPIIARPDLVGLHVTIDHNENGPTLRIEEIRRP